MQYNKKFYDNGGSSLLTPRFHFKNEYGEFDFPKYVEAFKKCLTSVWNYFEVPMEEDLKDWHSATTETKNIIGGILRGFTQSECVIGDFWADDIPQMFPKPEIVAMARWFSAYEVLHAFAYNHVSSSLGINEYQAFMGDQTAIKKTEFLLNEIDSKLVKLATFSAAEGVGLFSSFAILLSFNLSGAFKGLSMMISWSILDEQQHSDWGARLFKDLKIETNITQKEVDLIIEGFNSIVANELAFINNVFGVIDHINGVSKQSFIEFLKGKANERFRNLRLPEELLPASIDELFPFCEEQYQEVANWFDPLSSSNVSNDFFAHGKEGSQYISKPSFSMKKVNLGNFVHRLKDRKKVLKINYGN